RDWRMVWVAIIERLGTCRLDEPPEAVVVPARTTSQALPATGPARHPHRATTGPGRTGSRPTGRSGSARLAPPRAWRADGGRGRRRSAPRRSTRIPTRATGAARG